MNNLQKIRHAKGFSRKTMAKLLRISESYYKKLEIGQRPLTPTLEETLRTLFSFQKKKETKLEATFDWVALHFKTLDVEAVIEAILHMKLEEFMLKDYARQHYDGIYHYGHIEVYFSKNLNQGVLIEMTGQGCRELEEILQGQGREWYDLFNDCLVYENRLREVYALPDSSAQSYFNITRCDIALDEYYSEQGNYSLFNLAERLDDGRVSSRKRKFSIQRGSDFTGEGGQKYGLTIYIGSPKSSPFFRFYQKDAERANKLGLPLEVVHGLYGFKNRFEVVFYAMTVQTALFGVMWGKDLILLKRRSISSMPI